MKRKRILYSLAILTLIALFTVVIRATTDRHSATQPKQKAPVVKNIAAEKKNDVKEKSCDCCQERMARARERIRKARQRMRALRESSQTTSPPQPKEVENPEVKNCFPESEPQRTHAEYPPEAPRPSD